MVPEQKKDIIQHALQATFGVSEFEDISELTAGLSTALVYKIIVKDKPYMLKIIVRTDATSDPAHWFASMQAASDAGIAPKVWYMNYEERILIADFIETKPFPIDIARVKMPELLSRLHSLPAFEYRMNYIDAINGFIKKFKEKNLLPESMTKELFSLYEKVATAYPWNKNELVSCHNDLKPENILFDGEKVWLTDWEAAFLNDRYLDLAIVANFVINNSEDEREYLKIYLGREPDEYILARFFLMRQILHMGAFTAYMLFGGAADNLIDLNNPRPGFREFHDRVWSGDITLENNEPRQEYAMVHMEELKKNLSSERLEEALDIVKKYKEV